MHISGILCAFRTQFKVGEDFLCRVGLHLAKGEWEGAVNLIMSPRDGERDPMPDARRLYAEGNIGAAKKLMPPFAASECAILRVSDMYAIVSSLKYSTGAKTNAIRLFCASCMRCVWLFLDLCIPSFLAKELLRLKSEETVRHGAATLCRTLHSGTM